MDNWCSTPNSTRHSVEQTVIYADSTHTHTLSLNLSLYICKMFDFNQCCGGIRGEKKNEQQRQHSNLPNQRKEILLMSVYGESLIEEPIAIIDDEEKDCEEKDVFEDEEIDSAREESNEDDEMKQNQSGLMKESIEIERPKRKVEQQQQQQTQMIEPKTTRNKRYRRDNRRKIAEEKVQSQLERREKKKHKAGTHHKKTNRKAFVRDNFKPSVAL